MGPTMDPLNILTVCTGNICRSALAEYYLKHSLDAAHFAVASAGTHAVKNGRVPAPQVAIAHRLGLTGITQHVATQLSPAQISPARLILTATLEHRRRIVRMVPSAAKKTFSFREFAHLCSQVSEQDIIELTKSGLASTEIPAAAVHQLRGFVTPPEDPVAYDVVDPFGTDSATYETAANQLLSALRAVVPYLDKVASIAEQPDTGAARIGGKHSYDPVDPEQSDIRKRMTTRMREQQTRGESSTMRRSRTT